jgi:ubiquinone biosynthesis protein UbiJ
MADDLKQFAEEIKRPFDVTAESLRSGIRQVAEGVIRLADKTDRGFAEVRREFDEVKARIEFSHAEPARRLDSHEHDIADLRERVERLERKPS